MTGAVEALLLIAAVLGSLMSALWLVTRNPELRRQLNAERGETRRLRAFLAKLQAEAVGYADVNPVAQVFLDEITQELGPQLPARNRRSQ